MLKKNIYYYTPSSFLSSNSRFFFSYFYNHRFRYSSCEKRITDDSATIAKNSLHTIVHITISFDSSAVVELKRVQRCSRLCFISACELEIHPVSLSLSFFLSFDSTFGEMNTGGCTTVTESSCHWKCTHVATVRCEKKKGIGVSWRPYAR